MVESGVVGVGPGNLDELHRARAGSAPWLLDLVQPEVGGGRVGREGLARIEEQPAATALRISGLDQATFEAFVDGHGSRFTAIQFWKCPRLADLSPLERLPDLQLVSFYWNQRATQLWDMARTPQLRGLRLHDFTRLHDLGDLSRGNSLDELHLGDAVWDQSVVETLDPLSQLVQLRSLRFSAKRIDDGRIEPLAALQQLEELSFSAKQFATRQVAWLRARLPESLQSDALEPLRRLEKPLQLNGKERDVLLVGKGKPFLSSVSDAARIQKHVEAFHDLVREFTADPSRSPD